MELRVRDLYDDVDDERDATSESAGATIDSTIDEPTSLTRVLAALGERVSPISMAGERVLPVAPGLRDLFAEGGLVRGRTLSCVGSGATSLALSVVAAAAAGGSWVALVDVPTIGLDAATELGVPLERVVAIDTTQTATTQTVTSETATPTGASTWADVVAAAADGFELLIVRVPVDVHASTLRRVATRLQQRGVVMLVLGDPGGLVCDGVLEAATQTWSGIGNGWGHVAHRSIEVHSTGRRMPGRRCVTLAMPEAVPTVTEPIAPTAHVEFSNAS